MGVLRPAERGESRIIEACQNCDGNDFCRWVPPVAAHSFEGRCHHGLPPGCVNVDHVRSGESAVARGAPNRVRDIVELEIQKHAAAGFAELADQARPEGRVGLEADLEPVGDRSQSLRVRGNPVSIATVDRDTKTRFSVTHVPLLPCERAGAIAAAPHEPPASAIPYPCIMRIRGLLFQCAAAAGVAGMLAQILVLRVNPEVEIELQGGFVGLLLGVSWGALCLTIPLLPIAGIAARLRPTQERPNAWVLPELVFVVCLLAAVVNRLNASVHPFFLSSRGRRIIDQDGVGWLIVGLLVLFVGMWIRKRAMNRWFTTGLVCLAFVLPLVRVVFVPTPAQHVSKIEPRPIGSTSRALLMLGIEGLDSKILLSTASDSRYPALAGLVERGAWGPLRPYRPYLRRSIWTTVATGSYPRRHGVKSRWAWSFPYVRQPVRLLPWMPWGSNGFVAWRMGQRGDPPPARFPALWQRLGSSGHRTRVIAWPGIWSPAANVEDGSGRVSPHRVRDELIESLESAMKGLDSELRDELRSAVQRDTTAFEIARRSLEAGDTNVWIHIRSLADVRRSLEPRDARDVNERALQELVFEMIDEEIGRLLMVAPSGLLIGVVSPYGMAPPGPGERLRRVLGLGGRWRTSPETCPDGAFLLAGDGVLVGKRFNRARLADVAPTVCYLLGLPVAQYMEGRVVLDAVEPSFVANHPLKVTG